jgi:subtilisin family serine protease
MNFRLPLFLLIFLFITLNTQAQSTYFIKYKDYVDKSEIESKVAGQQFLPESISNRTASAEFRVDHLAKGIAKQDEVLGRIIKVSFKEDFDETTFLNFQYDDPSIEYIQKSKTYQLNFTPNDSLLSQQWALEKIRAFDAWDITTGSDTVLLAIIDTGIEYFHPDLQNKIYYNLGEIGMTQPGDPCWDGSPKDKSTNNCDDDGNGFIDDYMGWDFVDRVGFPLDTTAGDFLDWDNYPYDPIHGVNGFHSTFVAGIAGAETNNISGIAGAAPNIKLLNLRSFDNIGLGEEDDAAAAILYAVHLGEKVGVRVVINMSWGDNSFSMVLRDVIRYAYGRNVVLVASAGNSNSQAPHYPSGYTEVISVGNSTINDIRAGNSNYGSTLDLVAPGTEILSTTVGEDYIVQGGTSASAPHVSATAALILSLGDFTNEEVKQIIKSTCDDINTPGWDIQTGAGRLNMHRALSVLAPANIKFNFPTQDFATFEDTLNIKVSVLSPYFVSFDLYLGQGLNPTNWTPLVTNVLNQISGENIYTLNINSLNDDSYTLRLVVSLNNGSTTEERINFHIIRTPPEVLIVGEGPVYYGDRSTILAEAYTNQRSVMRMFYRKLGTGNFNFISLDGFITNNQFVKQFHYGFVPKDLVEPFTLYEVYYEAENMAGLTTTVLDTLNNLGYFIFRTDNLPQPAYYQQKDYTLPRGTLFADPVSFLSDSYNEVLFQTFYDSEIAYYGLLRLDGNIFERIDSVESKIPRQFGDFNNNGLNNLLSISLPNVTIDEQVSVNSFNLQNRYSDSRIFDPKIIYDLNNDGQKELITESPNKDMYIVWKVNQNFSIDTLSVLYRTYADTLEPGYDLNNRTTSNLIVADTDNDGRNEIWFMDLDGDLISYIVNSNGTFTKGDSLITIGLRTRNNNILDIGDYTGDGKKEIAILYQTNLIAPNFLLLIGNFDETGFNVVTQKVFLDQSAEYINLTFGATVYQSIRFADVDNDGADELVINVFPYVYILKYDPSGDRIIFYDEGVNTTKIFKGDLDQNGLEEIGLRFPHEYRFFEFASSNRTLVPVNFKGYSISSNSIRLTWNDNAEKYYIYKGTDNVNLEFIDSTFEAIYIDNDVETNKYYFYAVQAFDQSKQEPLSALSRILEVYSHTPAFINTVENNTNKTLVVTFSERINNTIENLGAFEVTGIGIPNSVSAASQTSYLLTFKDVLPVGNNTLIINGLRDYYGSPMPPDTALFNVIFIPGQEEFYISTHTLINPFLIKVQFNEEVDEASVSNTDNLIFNPDNKASGIEVDQSDKKIIYIHLDGKKPVGSIGREYTLHIQNVFSSEGILISKGAGSYIVLTTFTQDLSDVYVYPNPASVTRGEGKVTFANLPRRARINVYSLNGDYITEIEETDGNGGVDYHLTNKHGEKIGSGIYIYRIIMLDDANNEVEEKIGKFAVVK